VKQAILKTLAYSDVFSFPLAKVEIWRFLIWEKKTKEPLKKEFEKSLRKLIKEKTIGEKEGFFYLKNKAGLVSKRKKLEKINREKLKIARRFTQKIKFIPWVKAILITGALAVGNAKGGDDIDLLVITSEKRLWLTRFLAVFLAEVLWVRRRPGQKDVKNKICFNLFLSENYLKISAKNQNLFTAHEIAQARLVFEREKTYQDFLNANLWVRKYLPNGFTSHQPPTPEGGQAATSHQQDSKLKNKTSAFSNQPSAILNLLESLAYNLQIKYMESKKTSEKVSKNFAFFHPKKRGKVILSNYTRKIRKISV